MIAIVLGALGYLILAGVVVAATMRSSQMSATEGPFEVPIAGDKSESGPEDSRARYLQV
ncbi:MAG: hypothetical protein M5U01_43595 [Ardenticatenaceae bacterium]|nr:hypothetical protein [Ardenticatenaceae bacterium]